MKNRTGAIFLLMFCLTVSAAFAGQKPVNMSAQANATWCGAEDGMINCTTFPTGKQKYDGVTFDIPTASNAWFGDTAAAGGSASVSVTIPVNVKNVVTVYTLINTQWGSSQSGLLTITFTGSNGATWTYNLIGGTDMRDYNNGSYQNTIDCLIAGGLSQAGTVTAFNNGQNQRLDMQSYELPASFKGQTLQSITLTDNGNKNVQRAILAAVTVSTTLP